MKMVDNQNIAVNLWSALFLIMMYSYTHVYIAISTLRHYDWIYPKLIHVSVYTELSIIILWKHCISLGVSPLVYIDMCFDFHMHMLNKCSLVEWRFALHCKFLCFLTVYLYYEHKKNICIFVYMLIYIVCCIVDLRSLFTK